MPAQLIELLRTRITVVWLGLVAATVLALLLGADGLLHPAKLAGALVIVIAFTKVRFVCIYFMELRHAPTALRITLEGYCLVMCVAVTAVFLLAR